jgi:hypothetical protein
VFCEASSADHVVGLVMDMSRSLVLEGVVYDRVWHVVGAGCLFVVLYNL